MRVAFAGMALILGASLCSAQTAPACHDVVGIARLVMRANPNVRPEVLAGVVERYQVAMGCRQAPVRTQCSWVGHYWTCLAR